MDEDLGATQMEVNLSTQDVQDVFADESEGSRSQAAPVALFGEEEEDDDGPMESEIPSPRSQPAQEVEYVEERLEDQVDGAEHLAIDEDDDEIVRIPLEAPKARPLPSDKLTLIGLPTNVRVDAEPFDYEALEQLEKDCVNSKDVKGLGELKSQLLGDVIRAKGDKSTCKYVEFSDGTSAILIGDRTYTEIGSGMSDFNGVLFDVAQLPVMRSEGAISKRRIYTSAMKFKLNTA